MTIDGNWMEFGVKEWRAGGRIWDIGTLVLGSAIVAGGQWYLTFRNDARDGSWYGVTMATVVIVAWFVLCYGFMLPFNFRIRKLRLRYPAAIVFNGLRVQDLIDGASLVASEQRAHDVLIDLPVVHSVKFDKMGLTVFRGIRVPTEVFSVTWPMVESLELEDVTDHRRVRHALTLLVTSKHGLAALPIVILGAGPAGAFVLPLKKRQALVSQLMRLRALEDHR